MSACTMSAAEAVRYPYLIHIVTKRYFDAVDNKRLDDVLECFHDEAIFTIQTSFTRHAGKDAIRRMFVDFLGGYERIVHRDFTTTVDSANGRIAASFEAVLTGHDGQVTQLNNTNLWRVRGDRFQDVHVYTSGANVLV